MSSPSNASAVLRSLIVYAVSVPLAILVGYLLTNPTDYQSLGLIGFLIAILIFPVLMKWHYPWLLFSWTAPIVLAFLPGRPGFFIIMVVVSLSISVLERILNSNKQFLTVPQLIGPLIAMMGIIVMTAELTGGFGLRAMGSDVYGGKKYVMFFIGILSFFALIARPIPKEKAKLYITLFTLGAGLGFIMDLYFVLPAPLRVIYFIFNFTGAGMDPMGNGSLEIGTTALMGFQATGVVLASLMLLHHGVRGIFLSNKHWRPLAFGLCIMLVLLGGQRSSLIHVIMLSGILFWLEKMHRSRLMFPLLMAGLVGAALLVPLASHLPRTFQRSLSFLPLQIESEARKSAEDSSEWRLNMWVALLPQIPEHLLLGAGLAIKTADMNELGVNTGFKVIDAANDPLALAHDFHSGPLSMILSFGIWMVLAYVWFCAAGFYVLYRNYKYGDPALQLYNRYLLAFFTVSTLLFLLIVGDIPYDIARFCGILGLSVALNHGVRSPARHTQPSFQITPARDPLPNRPRPILLPR